MCVEVVITDKQSYSLCLGGGSKIFILLILVGILLSASSLESKKAPFNTAGFEFSNRRNDCNYSGTSVSHLESYRLFKGEQKRSFSGFIQTLQKRNKIFLIQSFVYSPLDHFAAKLEVINIFDIFIIKSLLFLVEGKDKIIFNW